MDQSWYHGCIKLFDEISGKHLVLYDDADEELFNLAEEKIEWPVEEEPVRGREKRKKAAGRGDGRRRGREEEGGKEGRGGEKEKKK